ICSDCHDWYAAAQCLVDGLHLLSPPQLPDGMHERICQQIMRDRARTIRARRALAFSAVAAGLLLVCGVVFRGSPDSPKLAAPGLVARTQPGRPLPSLQRQIEEASLAVVALTRRTADETVGETRLLLPTTLTQASVVHSPELEHAFEPSAQSL